MKYSEIERQVTKLKNMREQYLDENDWEKDVIDGRDRWFKRIPWGSGSEKTIAGDFLDAVNWQANHDKQAERKERHEVIRRGQSRSAD